MRRSVVFRLNALRRAALLAFCLCALAATACAKTVRGDLSARFPEPETVEVDGVRYQKREGIKTILLIGVDTTQAQDEARVGYRNGGQDDFLLLLVVDEERRTVFPVQIDRDAMVDMRSLGDNGEDLGLMFLQICLAHAYGDGAELSCEMTCEAVETLLGAPPIDHYVSMNMDAIPVLNDAVGGVTVTIEQDFTAFDPEMKPGATLRLNGRQATYFTRYRLKVGTQHNWERMLRQRAYISALSGIVYENEREDKNYIGRLYDELKPMLTTDMSRGAMINTAWAARDYVRMGTVMLPGVHVLNQEGYMEFYADEDALTQLRLSLFYKPVEGEETPGTP